MDHLEMLEVLRDRANVSYEEAKAVLEETNWELLDAMVAIEKAGKTESPALRCSNPGIEVQEQIADAHETAPGTPAEGLHIEEPKVEEKLTEEQSVNENWQNKWKLKKSSPGETESILLVKGYAVSTESAATTPLVSHIKGKRFLSCR